MNAATKPRPERQIYISSVRRETPDLDKLARALLSLAAQKKAEEEAGHE